MVGDLQEALENIQREVAELRTEEHPLVVEANRKARDALAERQHPERAA